MYNMGALPKKREEISPGESSQWRVGHVAPKMEQMNHGGLQAASG
jgi:hypothetical protein